MIPREHLALWLGVSEGRVSQMMRSLVNTWGLIERRGKRGDTRYTLSAEGIRCVTHRDRAQLPTTQGIWSTAFSTDKQGRRRHVGHRIETWARQTKHADGITWFLSKLQAEARDDPDSRVPGSGVRGRGSGERETTASSLAGKQQAREKEDNGGQGKDGPAGAIAQGGMDGDVDFLREALRVLVEGIMDAEVSSRIGAEYGERSPERVTQRNGYRSRAWDTRVGTMKLHIPKLREGSYFPSLLEPRRRSERALLAVIQQAYVEGVSTRRVDDLVKALGCEGISKSQVSRICQELDVVVDGFLGRPLDGGPYPYLWLDALTRKVREDGRIVNVSVVVATAVNGEGKREIIGMDVGTSEDGAFWLAFLRSLSARGLSGVELVVSDAHQGLRGAIAAVFGGASRQRCRTHFMTNLLTRVPRRAQPWVATMVRTIYQQPSPDEVHAQLDTVTSQLHDRFPEVASLLDEAGPDVLAFSSFPLAHWKKLWSNNPQERLNKEIRRRTDVVGIFPNRPAVRRLVGAVLAEQHDEWVVGRRYLTPAILTFNEALPEADLAEATAA